MLLVNAAVESITIVVNGLHGLVLINITKLTCGLVT